MSAAQGWILIASVWIIALPVRKHWTSHAMVVLSLAGATVELIRGVA